MSECNRTMDDVKTLLQSIDRPRIDPRESRKLYNVWAATYDQDFTLMNYRAPQLAAQFISEHFSGNPEDALVLDVACGSGWVARRMAELGFKNFEGVDGSRAMLDQAAKTGLYKDLRLALLGPEALPARTGVFDVVVIVGALNAGYVHVSVVRELCGVAKPGGLVCMVRSDHGGISLEYKADLDRELQRMEEEGLWTPVGIKLLDRYMEDPYAEEICVSGTAYLFKKSID